MVLIYPTVASKTISLKLKPIKGSFAIETQHFADFYRVLQNQLKSTIVYYKSQFFTVQIAKKKNNVFGQYLSVNLLKLDTERTLNVHKMFGRRPGRQVIVLCVQVGREIEGIQISETTSVLERVVIESP